MDDKFSHDERLRLECLAQAVSLMQHVAFPLSTEISVAGLAELFEQYVRFGVTL